MEGIRKYPYRRRFTAVATGGTYDYVKSERVPPGEVWVIRSHSFENLSGARGTARGFIDKDGLEHWLWEQTSPAEDRLYWSEEDMSLTEGERLAVRQATCTSGDELRLLLNGYIIYGSEGQVV